MCTELNTYIRSSQPGLGGRLRAPASTRHRAQRLLCPAGTGQRSRRREQSQPSLRRAPSAPARRRCSRLLPPLDSPHHTWHACRSKHSSVMDKRGTSGRGEPIPSILKKPKGRRKGDLLDKSSKIKREKVEGPKGEDVSAPLPQGCTPLMYACQQADYKAVVDTLNKDVSSSSSTNGHHQHLEFWQLRSFNYNSKKHESISLYSLPITCFISWLEALLIISFDAKKRGLDSTHIIYTY